MAALGYDHVSWGLYFVLVKWHIGKVTLTCINYCKSRFPMSCILNKIEFDFTWKSYALIIPLTDTLNNELKLFLQSLEWCKISITEQITIGQCDSGYYLICQNQYFEVLWAGSVWGVTLNSLALKVKIASQKGVAAVGPNRRFKPQKSRTGANRSSNCGSNGWYRLIYSPLISRQQSVRAEQC